MFLFIAIIANLMAPLMVILVGYDRLRIYNKHMIIALILIGLIIYLIALFFRYKSVKANAFSRKEMQHAAHKQANKLSYMDPIITCDYCGAKIDTQIHKVCPHCGGAFDRDIEWVERHDAGDEFIDRGTEKLIKAREQKAAAESKIILDRMKRTMLILVGIIVALVAIAVIFDVVVNNSGYKKDEPLNRYSFENYSLADYQIEGDGIIYDKDGIKVTATGIYVDERTSEGRFGEEFSGDVKVEILVENSTEYNINLSMSSESFCNISESGSGFYAYDKYKKNSKTTIYGEFTDVPMQKLSEFIVSSVRVSSSDYEFSNESNGPITIKTTSDYEYHPQLPTDNLVFSNDTADIYAEYTDEYSYDAYRLFVVSKSDESFVIESNDLRVDGETVRATSIYKDLLPAHYTFIKSYIRAYESVEDLDAKKVEMSISFHSENEPSLNFATGYFDLNDGITQDEIDGP